MDIKSFQSKLLSGHKEDAIEVPFDPSQLGLTSQALWLGRRGYRVKATLNGYDFEGAVVARSKRFWLLVPEPIEQAAGVIVGDSVQVSLRA